MNNHVTSVYLQHTSNVLSMFSINFLTMMYKIFDPYVTTKSQGRGLGLPIVKKIVEDHNGSIKLRSDKRKGTRVFVVLPQELKSAAI